MACVCVHRHFATGRGPSSTFSWFAPHQPRIDHQAFYASVGVRPSHCFYACYSLVNSLTAVHTSQAHLGSIDRTNPCYSHNGAVWLENLVCCNVCVWPCSCCGATSLTRQGLHQMLQLMRGSKDVQQLMQWSSVGVPFDGDDAPEFMRAPQFLLKCVLGPRWCRSLTPSCLHCCTSLVRVSSCKEFASRGVRCFRLALPRTWVVPLMTRSDQAQGNSSSNLFACNGL